MALRAKDIAEMLGVSTAAVSLTINNKPGVGEEKRQEILNKIRELGCEYLLKTEPLSRNKGLIGFVIYKKSGRIINESPFFNYILEGINTQLLKHGYLMNFIYVGSDMPDELLKSQLLSGDYEGFLIFGVEMEREDLQIFVDTGIPFTILDNSFRESDVDSVSINNSLGTFKAIQYLHQCGHKEIGYLRCRERIASFEERYLEYRLSMEKLNLDIREEQIVDVDYSEAGISADINRYLDSSPALPTAFFAENDFIACNAMLAFQARGYRFPEDLSMIGFDDRQICQMVTPKLTTVNVPKDLFGPSAVDLLISRIETGRSQSLKINIGTNLIIRESVRNL